jgi:two-component system phosphate regulon sensor histidine kinase PhoR
MEKMAGRWRGHGANLVVAATVVVFSVTALWAWWQLRAHHVTAFEQEAIRQVAAVANSAQLAEAWLAGPEPLRQELAQVALITGAQVTALSNEGNVIARSSGSVGEGEVVADWSHLPEVRAGLVGRTGTSTRAENDEENGEQPLFMVARLVRAEGRPLGLLHFAFGREALFTELAQLNRILFLTALVALLLLGLVLATLAEYWARGVGRMVQVVERITAGDLDARVLPLRYAELGALAHALNRMADKLQRQMKKRAREKDRLNTVLHVMTDGVIILNRSGTVKLINPAGARMLNTTIEKALHRSFVQAVRDHRIAEVWKRCQASGVEEGAAIELGVTQFMRVVVTPFLGRAGRGYLVMLQDLTQIRRLQRVRQDFMSNLSHELRTPLASLRALAETLRDSALDDPPAAAHFLDRMEIEVDSLTQMVEELLELSRIESGQVPLRLEAVPPHAAIAPAVERLAAQAERGQLALEVLVPEEMPLVLVDASRIHQVVTNIVHNAIKFTPPGGKITVHARADGTTVTVAVSDTGIGIAANDLPRIFERFFKTDRSRAVGGTGLGLAIAKHIVQAHGGSIWATSQEGKGSDFYFTMLRAEPVEGGEQVADSEEGKPGGARVNQPFTAP